jgi:hypothetical protein
MVRFLNDRSGNVIIREEIDDLHFIIDEMYRDHLVNSIEAILGSIDRQRSAVDDARGRVRI